MISGNFQNVMIFMRFPSVLRRRVLRTPSPYAIGNVQSYMYVWVGFFNNISGYLCSFGTALFVVQDIGSVQVVVAAGWPRKSI